jgi:hypothetical protein
MADRIATCGLQTERGTFQFFIPHKRYIFPPFMARRTSSRYPISAHTAAADHALLRWPPRSPDLMPCDLLLWGYIDSVILQTLSKDLLQLWRQIIAAISEIDRDMLQLVWAEVDCRLDICLVTKGSPIEDLCGMRKKKSWRFSVFVCRSVGL